MYVNTLTMPKTFTQYNIMIFVIGIVYNNGPICYSRKLFKICNFKDEAFYTMFELYTLLFI